MKATASCQFPLLNEWKSYCDHNKICAFADSVISGYAQLAFNDNTFSGILMMLATVLGSPVLFVSAIWATIVATLTAHAIKLPEAGIRAGLYNVNAALSGLAVPPLLFANQGLSIPMLLVSTFIGIITVFLGLLVGKFFEKHNLPSLVIPYCICLLSFLAFMAITGITNNAPLSLDALVMTCSASDWSLHSIGTAFLNSASQIVWLSNPLSGLLYLIALTFASRADFFNTLVAIIISIFVAILIGLPQDPVINGHYGYNAILLIQVLSRSFKSNVHTRIFSFAMVSLTPVMCVIYQLILTSFGISSFLALPYLTICFPTLVCMRKHSNFIFVSPKHWGVPETIQKINQET